MNCGLETKIAKEMKSYMENKGWKMECNQIWTRKGNKK